MGVGVGASPLPPILPAVQIPSPTGLHSEHDAPVLEHVPGKLPSFISQQPALPPVLHVPQLGGLVGAGGGEVGLGGVVGLGIGGSVGAAGQVQSALQDPYEQISPGQHSFRPQSLLHPAYTFDLESELIADTKIKIMVINKTLNNLLIVFIIAFPLLTLLSLHIFVSI